MSLNLSQLFEHHKTKYSSKTKKEETYELDDDGGNINEVESMDRSAIDLKQSTNIEHSSSNPEKKRKSQKRGKQSISSLVRNEEAIGAKVQLITRTKRIKTEPSNDVKKEDEKLKKETQGTEYCGEEELYEGDGDIEHTSDHMFYQNFSESARALYNFREEDLEQPSHSEALEILHLALFPRTNKGTLAIENERRLAGDYDNGGDDDGYPSRSLSGRYRKRRVQNRVKTKGPSGKKDISFRLESQDEVQDRVQRMEGYAERSELQNRWKRRSVNFQSEDDIGDAFLIRAQQNLGEKLRSDEKERRMKERREMKAQRKQRKKEEIRKIKEIETSDILEEDDEVKEQSQLLAQLSQQDTVIKEESKDPTSSHRLNLLPQRLNYWELGYALPQKASIPYDFNQSVEKMVKRGTKRALESSTIYAKDNVETNEETKVCFSSLMKKQSRQRQSSRFFFESNRTLISNGNNTFRPGYRSGHIHQMLSMAARSLCGGVGSKSKDEIDLENRYFRLLCLRYEDLAMKCELDSTICADFRKSGYLTALAEDQGENMLLYLQNIWDEPTEVAKRLGILDCLLESPMKGNLLNSIKFCFKSNRSRIKTLHKIRSINWDHDNNDDGFDPDKEDLDEESQITLDPKTIPEVTTTCGLVNPMLKETSFSFDEKEHLTISKDARDAFISPNSLYCHISGTSPPTPNFPLDPSAWMFGPVDRYSKFYHGGVKMDSSVYKVMLSTLMKRIGCTRTMKNKYIASDAEKQIMNLIEEFANINENKLYLRYTNSIQDPLDSDIPIVEFYRGVVEYCAYMANGYLEMLQSDTSPNRGIKKSYQKYDGSQECSEISLIAGKIWEFCRLKIRRNSLMRFPKLKIVFGIALICRSLSPSASEILSRPINKDDFCTPLDLFKQTLEDMESKKYIVTNRNVEDNSILAVELEFLLHDASKFFQEAIELDPTNTEYHLWHIGCLASSLLISSGNNISDSVHVYPSQIKGTFTNYESIPHEVRPCMKKYEEVRIELSTAVRALITLAKYQNSPKAHFAVFSLLEWGQVIGLLVGCQLNRFLDDIDRLHAFHFSAWAKNEPATFLREFKCMPNNTCIKSIYAQILENDPGEIRNWRNFVFCLGSISDIESHDWWGKDRCWWGDSLLHLFTPNTCDRVLFKAPILDVLRKFQNAKSASSIPAHNFSTMGRMHTKHKEIFDDENRDWLPTRESVMVENEDQSKIPKGLRTKCYANKLPRTKKNTLCEKNEISSTLIPLSGNLLLQDLVCLPQEAQAYKILVFCHLFGQGHQSVQKYVYYSLFCKCVCGENNTVDENCDQFQVLIWLSSMGINVENIIENITITIQ